MKNYLRIFAFMLAAVFVFTACDSSGDGGNEQQQSESVSYSGRTGDGKEIKLTLTGAVAAKKTSAGGFRVPAAFTDGGTYTLHIGNTLASSGEFAASDGGDTLTFTSNGGKTFSAAATGNTPPAFTGDIELDTDAGGLATLKQSDAVMYNEESFEIQVYEPDGTTPFDGDVTIYGVMYDDGCRDGKMPISGAIGNITDGKLTLNLKALKNNELFLFEEREEDEEGNEFGPVLSTSYMGSLCFTDGTEVIALSLQGPATREYFNFFYSSEQFLNEDGSVEQEKGWNYSVEGDDWEGGQAHPLEWFTANGYKWVYRANPLKGTWTGPGGDNPDNTLTFGGELSGTYTWEANGMSSSGTFTASGTDITFNQTSPSSTTWTQEFAIGGNCLAMQNGDGFDEDNNWKAGFYLRKE